MFVFLANNIIKSDKVERVMKAVDRGNYTSKSPYLDQPQGIGFGVTISAPHMVKFLIIRFLILLFFS